SFIKGASLAIWNDNPDLVGEDVITEDITKELRSLATKSWNTSSNVVADIDQFRANYAKLGNVAGFEKGSELPNVEPVHTIEPELVENAAELKELVQQMADEGDVEAEAVQHLTIQLKSVNHYENKKSADKVVKHMEGFLVLLDYYKKQRLIVDDAFEKLSDQADHLVEL